MRRFARGDRVILADVKGLGRLHPFGSKGTVVNYSYMDEYVRVRFDDFPDNAGEGYYEWRFVKDESLRDKAKRALEILHERI